MLHVLTVVTVNYAQLHETNHKPNPSPNPNPIVSMCSEILLLSTYLNVQLQCYLATDSYIFYL